MSRHEDGNIAALNRYQYNQEKAEAHYEDFIQAVLDELQDDMTDLEARYAVIAKEYGVDKHFTSFINQEML